MATRARTTFQKRQKEMARKERQQRKAERREQRKMGRTATDRVSPPDEPPCSDAESDRGAAISRHITVES
jgi:hypothetical protein